MGTIVELHAARCAPSTPGRVVPWSTEEEVRAARALRGELRLERTRQARTAFSARERRVARAGPASALL